MKRIKQGQTKWQTVVYEPGKIDGYDNVHVAVVYSCYVTRVVGNQVYYNCSNGGPYICTDVNWNTKKHKTYRKAWKEAVEKIGEINRGNYGT